MLAILRTLIHVVNSILHLVAVALVTGGSILISLLVILLIAAAFLGLSSLGLSLSPAENAANRGS